MVLHATKENFENEVIKSELPVIVDFWAEWCGPCKMMGPVFEELSKEYKGKLKFVKVDTEEFPEISGQYGIQGIPSLLVLKSGTEIGRIVGFNPKEELKAKIDKII